jgi:hypothetical protein
VVGLLLVAHLDALPVAPALFLVIVFVHVVAVMVLAVVLPAVILLVITVVFACPMEMSAVGALEQVRGGRENKPSWARARANKPRQTKAKRITLSFIVAAAVVVVSCVGC